MNNTQNARYLITLISVIALATACSKSDMHSDTVEVTKPAMEALVSTEWLSEHLDDPDLVVLDSTVLIEIDENGGFNILSGRAQYETGHIPSAGFADLMGDLSDPERPAQFIMPTAERFAAAMGTLGVGDDSRVVLYTANNPDWAARVWWMSDFSAHTCDCLFEIRHALGHCRGYQTSDGGPCKYRMAERAPR